MTLEVGIDEAMRVEAQRKATEMGPINNSFLRGEGNVYGFIGELMFAQVTGGEVDNTYEWDVVMPNGVTVDVKTKCVTSPPFPDYDCSVAAAQVQQMCDYYAFVRVLKDLSMGWYLGALTKPTFFNTARWLKAGTVDGSNGWAPPVDCYNVKISDLYLDPAQPDALPTNEQDPGVPARPH